MKLTFLKITDIDTVTQQFEAEIFVQAKWEEPLLKDSEYALRGKTYEVCPFGFSSRTARASKF